MWTYLEFLSLFDICGAFRGLVQGLAGAGEATVGRGDPGVGGACVEDDREGLLVGADLDVTVVLHVLVILNQNLALDLRGGHRLVPSPTKPTSTHSTKGAAMPIPTQVLLLGTLDLAVLCVCVCVCVYVRMIDFLWSCDRPNHIPTHTRTPTYPVASSFQ